MFRVILGTERNGIVSKFTVSIDKCPYSGLEAIDFRRAHGLPDAPTNKITLNGIAFEDESFIRQWINQATSECDINMEYFHQYSYGVTSKGEVYQRSTTAGIAEKEYTGYQATCSADVIKAYMDNTNVDTAKQLIVDLFKYSDRSKLAAQETANQFKLDQEQLKIRKSRKPHRAKR